MIILLNVKYKNRIKIIKTKIKCKIIVKKAIIANHKKINIHIIYIQLKVMLKHKYCYRINKYLNSLILAQSDK